MGRPFSRAKTTKISLLNLKSIFLRTSLSIRKSQKFVKRDLEFGYILDRGGLFLQISVSFEWQAFSLKRYNLEVGNLKQVFKVTFNLKSGFEFPLKISLLLNRNEISKWDLKWYFENSLKEKQSQNE